MNAKLDHQEIIEYLSEISNGQELLRQTMDGTDDLVRQVMSMMQSVSRDAFSLFSLLIANRIDDE